MRISRLILSILSGAFLLAPPIQAQTCRPIQSCPPVRSTTVISYCNGAGTAKLALGGTELLSEAHGKAEIEARNGFVGIKMKMEHLVPASIFGVEYLTYVLWAITPDGKPVNLGEIVLDSNNHARLDVMVNLPAFGLIVTAEPYFAVTEPSDIVVLDNRVESCMYQRAVHTAKYQLVPRGHYIANLRPVDVKGIGLVTYQPLEVNEAQNAVRIALWAGADVYAPDLLANARFLLRQAERLQGRDPDDFDTESVSTAARAAVEAAEDARSAAAMCQCGESVPKCGCSVSE
jgi:hypothetical protein